MDKKLLRITDQVRDQLRCSQCKGYLSCGPVRLLPDGTSICGQCSPSNSDIVVYRELLLEEAILKKVAFPCPYKTKGCRVNVAFGQAVEHKLKCAHHSYQCPLPVSNNATCSWNGSLSQLLDHLTKSHSSCFLKAASLTIRVGDNGQGVFAALQDNMVLLVTYMYTSSTRIFNYDVRYFGVDRATSASYKINIENQETPDYNVSLKKQPCPMFDSSFNKTNNMIDLSKCIDFLDNPNIIKINIILNSGNLDMLNTDTVKNNLIIDYEKLALLLCQKCHKEYLVLPIFKSCGQTLCLGCSTAVCNPDLSDVTLQQRIAEANFPCRWQSCNFIDTGATIRAHEIQCQFRDYSCPKCSALINATFAAKHLLSHGTEFVSGFHKVPLSNNNSTIYVFLIENNKVITVKFEYKITWDSVNGYKYSFIGELLLGTFKDEKVIVQFNYENCSTRGLAEFIFSEATPTIDYFKHTPPCHRRPNIVTVKLRKYE